MKRVVTFRVAMFCLALFFLASCHKAESSDEGGEEAGAEPTRSESEDVEGKHSADEVQSAASDLLDTKVEVDGSRIDATFDGRDVEIRSATVVLAKSVAISRTDPVTWRRVQLWTEPVTCKEAQDGLPKLPEKGRDY